MKPKKGIILLLILALLTGCYRGEKEPADTVLVTINGEEVSEAEGRLYLEMMERIYEEKGGKEIWDIPLSGQDSRKTAEENALDSLIRTKILAREYDPARLTDSDRRNIERGIIKVTTLLGEKHLKAIGLEAEDLARIMEESYRAFRFERGMSFLPGTMESELDQRVAEAFIAYEVADQDAYLQRVSIDAIMIYTGEWIDGTWVRYPASQREEKLARMEEAYARIQAGGQFALTRNWYTEDKILTDSPVLSEGVVVSEDPAEYLYQGQIQDDVAEAIFKTPAGETTGILETQYGYILVKVLGFSKPGYLDQKRYEEVVDQAREEYRTELIQELEAEQLESEYSRLLEQAAVDIHEDVWDRITKR